MQYENGYKKRLDIALQKIGSITKEAVSFLIKNIKYIGRPPKICVEDKVIILLFKDIVGISNRKTARLFAVL